MKRSLILIAALAVVGCQSGPGYDPGSVKVECDKHMNKYIFQCSYQPGICQTLLQAACQWSDPPRAPGEPISGATVTIIPTP
jgi:hypothetical protein